LTFRHGLLAGLFFPPTAIIAGLIIIHNGLTDYDLRDKEVIQANENEERLRRLRSILKPYGSTLRELEDWIPTSPTLFRRSRNRDYNPPDINLFP
jgi:hypothetical protein